MGVAKAAAPIFTIYTSIAITMRSSKSVFLIVICFVIFFRDS